MSTEQEQNNENLLDNFNWDSDETFFGIPSTSTIATPKTPEVVIDDEDDDEVVPNDKTVETNTTTQAPVVEEEEIEMFSEKNNETPTEEDESFYTVLSKEMKEKGIFQNVDLPEVDNITEESFFELHEAEIEARTDQTIQGFIDEINNEDGAAFLKFIRAGGKVSEFFNFYTERGTVPEVDVKTETGQDVLLRHYYKTYENLDDEDIDDKLTWLKESGKKAKYAEKYNQKMVEDQNAERDRLVSQKEEQQRKREQDQRNFVTNLKTTLETSEGFNGFVFNKKENTALVDYVTKPQVKLSGNQYLTQFQSDLAKIIKEEPQKLLVIAKLMKSDFDTSDIVDKKKTEATTQIKKSLNSKDKKPTSTLGTKKRSLSEYF